MLDDYDASLFDNGYWRKKTWIREKRDCNSIIGRIALLVLQKSLMGYDPIVSTVKWTNIFRIHCFYE